MSYSLGRLEILLRHRSAVLCLAGQSIRLRVRIRFARLLRSSHAITRVHLIGSLIPLRHAISKTEKGEWFPST